MGRERWRIIELGYYSDGILWQHNIIELGYYGGRIIGWMGGRTGRPYGQGRQFRDDGLGGVGGWKGAVARGAEGVHGVVPMVVGVEDTGDEAVEQPAENVPVIGRGVGGQVVEGIGHAVVVSV